jgi:DNA polymerase-3 subunit gamma/tau
VLAFTGDRVTGADVSTVLGLIGRDLQFEIAETIAREDVPAVFAHADSIVEAGFDLRIVCRELARLMRDLMVVKIDPGRLDDPEIAAEGERDRLKAMAGEWSREDLLRAFDLLGRTEYDIRNSSQPRHTFEMALVKWIHLRQLTPLADLIASLEGGKPQSPATQGLRTPAPKAPSAPPKPAAEPRAPKAEPRPRNPEPKAQNPEPRGQNAGAGIDPKAALLSAIRARSRSFYSMVVAQAKSVELEGDTVVFTFSPVHKSLRAEFDRQRSWLDELAKTCGPARLSVAAKEGAPIPTADEPDEASKRKAELTEKAKAEPTVQAVLDVFGGTIEDVEEI